jgi:hypothetical protein
VTCRLCGRRIRFGEFCRGGDTFVTWCLWRSRVRLGLPIGLAHAWRKRDLERMSQARGQG